MKVLKFEEYINELWSKGLNRSKFGHERLEDLDMTPDEKKCYELLKEWCSGGQLNVQSEMKQSEPRHSFNQDFEQFQKNLYDELSKLECCKLLIDVPQYAQSKFIITNIVNNGYGVICSTSFQNKLQDEIYMFVMEETDENMYYYTLSTHYYDESNVEIMRRKLKNLVFPKTDSPYGIYIACRVPEKVLLKVMAENRM